MQLYWMKEASFIAGGTPACRRAGDGLCCNSILSELCEADFALVFSLMYSSTED